MCGEKQGPRILLHPKNSMYVEHFIYNVNGNCILGKSNMPPSKEDPQSSLPIPHYPVSPHSLSTINHREGKVLLVFN